MELHWCLITGSTGTNQGIQKYSVLETKQHISNAQLLNVKPNNVKGKQTEGFWTTPDDCLTYKIVNDVYEKWQLGPCHGQTWQSVTDSKDTTADCKDTIVLALALEKLICGISAI